MRAITRIFALAWLGCYGWAAEARSADDSPEVVISAYSGGEVDDDGGRRIDLGLSASTAGHTTYSLTGSHSNVDNGTGSLVSRTIAADLNHDFERFGLRGGIRQVRDDDVAKSLTWLGGIYAKFELVKLGFTAERRKIDFDDTPFMVSGSDLGLTSVTGVAACDLESTGYGLSGNLRQSRWSLYGSAATYSYSGYECSATLTTMTGAGGPGPGTSTPGSSISVRRSVGFERVAATATRRFEGVSASRIPRENTLLDSKFMLGAQINTGPRTSVGAEAYRDTDEFSPSKTMTFLAYVDWVVTRAVAITATIGSSDSDSAGRLQFMGLRATVSL